MATVYIGSASIDENGKAHGGKAGNQTGRELKKQAWYAHSKGWRVFRAKDGAAAEKIAACMAAAIENRHIGYDQYQRNTLYREAAKVGFDVSKVTADCETDCSALVRVCCACAGILGLPEGFRTTNEPRNLLATGAFTELAGDRYTRQSAYLKRGDILCTCTQGHTVVVLNDGKKAESDATGTSSVSSGAADQGPAGPISLETVHGTVSQALDVPKGEGLRRGDYGSAVTAMQRLLLKWDKACLPKYGADGDFGGETERALKDFQNTHNLPVTGVYDERTRELLAGMYGEAKPAPVVEITGGTVNVRTAPGVDVGKKMGVVKQGDRLPWQGESRDVGGTPWHLVEFKNQNGWVSGKFSKVVA